MIFPHRKLNRLEDDRYLDPYHSTIFGRREKALWIERRVTGGKVSLPDFASGHEYYGLHRSGSRWVFREWAPNATGIRMIGDFTQWRESDEWALRRISDAGAWEIDFPGDALSHGDLYKLVVHWNGGQGERIPSYARRVVQDDTTKIFNAQVWEPGSYAWKHPSPVRKDFVAPLIYETHVGMAQEKYGIGSYDEFRRGTLPRIAEAGYNTVQLMAIMEHPYYGSFGYQVSSFFAASSRYGTPHELKALIDDAHGLGLSVVMDLVHSHAVRNELEGLSLFDGTPYQYFHDGQRGEHIAWNSKCFDYGKTEVLHFLLSNCRFWLDEYNFDGFRFDGITSMLYYDHGLGTAFDNYDKYFGGGVDEDALAYLMLANKLIHHVRPDAITIAEDISGMPGLCAPLDEGGIGFDYRMAMGIPDYWFRLVRKCRDDDWSMDNLWHELTNRRGEERTISYVECHDQAIVGDKTMIFELIDADMYWHMETHKQNLQIDRGMALHKMMRLATVATCGFGYLNFMGNEFGHPEWIDFPREGNSWSYHYARRQWSLRDNGSLKYHFLADFDREMLRIVESGRIIEDDYARKVFVHCDDKILAFERGPLLFIFNFHPSRSVTDYFIDAPHCEYVHIFDSDEGRFGGFGRVAGGQRHQATENFGRKGVRVYLPCRVAMVLRAQPIAQG